MKTKLEPDIFYPVQEPDFLSVSPSNDPLELRCLQLLDYIPSKRQHLLKAPEIIEVRLPHSQPSLLNKYKQWNDPKIPKRLYKKTSRKKKKMKHFIRGRKYRVIEVPTTSGKKPKVEKRWQMLCNHCDVLFFARPTPKNSRYVVNHQCQPDGNRRQYIIGVKGRNCVLPHESACIQHVECFGECQ